MDAFRRSALSAWSQRLTIPKSCAVSGGATVLDQDQRRCIRALREFAPIAAHEDAGR